MTKRSIDTPPPGEGPGRRERKPRRSGARFSIEGRLDCGERGLWHIRVYLSHGRWWISARRHRKRRVWVVSAEAGSTAVVRAAIRAELATRTGIPVDAGETDALASASTTKTAGQSAAQNCITA